MQIKYDAVLHKLREADTGGAVESVNGQTGVVVLDAADVGAAPALGADDNYVTDAEKTKLSNLSGTNTGDVTVTDTNSIDLSLTGQALTADLKKQNSTSVDLSIDASGLKADLNATLKSGYDNAATQAHDAVTVTDTASVDLSLTGQALSATVLPAGVDHGSLGGLTDDDHSQYLLATGARTGGSSSGQVFTQPIIITGYDYPNTHATDSDYFNTTIATGNPASGFTAVDAALTSNVNVGMKGAWYLNGSLAETSWKYKRQLQPIVETSYMGINIGPIFLRDGGFTANLTYSFGIYADDGAGTIDETKFSRVELNWSSGSTIWQVRHVTSDGSTTNTGAYKTLPFPVPQGFYVRPMTYTVGTNKRGYFGLNGSPQTQTMLQSVALAITWNQPWFQIEMSRGSGVEDYLYIGGYNRNNQP